MPTFFRDLDPANPTDASLISQGDDELRSIKQALFDQFPNFISGPADPSLAELNQLVGINTGAGESVQEQLDYLNARAAIQPLPSGARNFLNSFWSQTGAEDQQRLYSDYAQFQDYSNVPWPWGNNMGGRDLQYIGLLIQRYVNETQSIAFHIVTRVNLGTLASPVDNFVQTYMRAAGGPDAATDILGAPWQRGTVAQISADQATSGDVISTTAKNELESPNVCNGPIC